MPFPGAISLLGVNGDPSLGRCCTVFKADSGDGRPALPPGTWLCPGATFTDIQQRRMRGIFLPSFLKICLYEPKCK